MEIVTGVATCLAALKNFRDLVQSANPLSRCKAAKAKIRDLEAREIDLSAKCFALEEEKRVLVEQVARLEAQCVSHENWEAEKSRYDLKDIGPGAYAYVLKPVVDRVEPPHWLCAACFEKHQKAVLQANGPAGASGNEARQVVWKCPDCSAAIRVPFLTKPS